MKRTLFALVVFFVAFISCKDKPVVLAKDGNSEEGIEQNPFLSVPDSAFYYEYNSDGSYSAQKIYYYYDTEGKEIKRFSTIDKDGILTKNQEMTFNYKSYWSNANGYDYDYTVYCNNNGLDEDTKTENKRSGSDGKHISYQKEFKYHDGKWLLMKESSSQQNSGRYYTRVISYDLYNGEIIVVSRSERTSTLFSNNTRSVSESTYQRPSLYSYTNGGVRVNVYGDEGRWTRNIINYDAAGRLLERSSFTSNDSINWIEGPGEKYKYDSNGNKLESMLYGYDFGNYKICCKFNSHNKLTLQEYYEWSETEKVFVPDSKIEYAYNGQNRLVSEQYYVWSQKETAYYLQKKALYSYTSIGSLSSIVVNSVTNDISPSNMPLLAKIFGYNTNVGVSFKNSAVSWDSNVDYIFDNSIKISYTLSERITLDGCARCTIECDSNENPTSEIFYKLDEDNKLVEFLRCSFDFDSNGNCVQYEIKNLVDGSWSDLKTCSSSFDSNNNRLSEFMTTSTVDSSYYDYYDNGNLKSGYIINYNESESTLRATYDSFDMNYYFSSSIDKSHSFYPNGQEVYMLKENETTTSITRDEMGYEIYKYSSTKQHNHGTISYMANPSMDRENDICGERIAEEYHSTIKVK